MLATKLSLNVNGQKCELSADVRSTLLDVLRESLGLTGTKKGCDQGPCGACTVHVDGVRVLSDIGEVEAIVVPEEDSRVNALGVKGIGELANTGTAAAIANAVHHATGRRIRRLPIRIEGIL